MHLSPNQCNRRSFGKMRDALMFFELRFSLFCVFCNWYWWLSGNALCDSVTSIGVFVPLVCQVFMRRAKIPLTVFRTRRASECNTNATQTRNGLSRCCLVFNANETDVVAGWIALSGSSRNNKMLFRLSKRQSGGRAECLYRPLDATIWWPTIMTTFDAVDCVFACNI